MPHFNPLTWNRKLDYTEILRKELLQWRKARDEQVRQWRGLKTEEYCPDD